MIIHATFGLQKSNNVIHMFGTWLQGIKWKERNLILTGVSIVCWAMWVSTNDIVFKSEPTTLFVDPFQGNTLDKIMGFASERRDL